MLKSNSITIWIFPNIHKLERKVKKIWRRRITTTSIILRKSKKKKIERTVRGKGLNAIGDREGGSTSKTKEKVNKD